MRCGTCGMHPAAAGRFPSTCPPAAHPLAGCPHAAGQGSGEQGHPLGSLLHLQRLQPRQHRQVGSCHEPAPAGPAPVPCLPCAPLQHHTSLLAPALAPAPACSWAPYTLDGSPTLRLPPGMQPTDPLAWPGRHFLDVSASDLGRSHRVDLVPGVTTFRCDARGFFFGALRCPRVPRRASCGSGWLWAHATRRCCAARTLGSGCHPSVNGLASRCDVRCSPRCMPQAP